MFTPSLISRPNPVLAPTSIFGQIPSLVASVPCAGWREGAQAAKLRGPRRVLAREPCCACPREVETQSLQFCRRTPSPGVPGHAKLQKGADLRPGAHVFGGSKPTACSSAGERLAQLRLDMQNCRQLQNCAAEPRQVAGRQVCSGGSPAQPCEARSAAKVQDVSDMTERWLPAGKITISGPSWTYRNKHHPRHLDDARRDGGSPQRERRQPRKAPVFSGPIS